MARPPEAQPAKSRHLKRNLVIVVAVLAVLSASIIAVTGFAFGVSGCPGCPAAPSPVQFTSVSCSVKNNSCELVMLNTGKVTARAGWCGFNEILGPKNGVNNSVIVPGSSGVLSDKPGGSVNQTIPIAPGASVIAYCTPVGNHPTAGTPVQGQVEWVEPGEDWQYPGFSATWA